MSRRAMPPLRPALLLPAALLLAGAALLGCPGTLENKACYLDEERAHTLLAASCTDAGCHNASDKSTGLDLQSPGIGARLKDKAALGCDGSLIEAGNPEASILYGKLHDPPPCGSRMPLARPELYPEDIELIRVWIAGMDGSCAGESTTGSSGGTTTTASGSGGTTGSGAGSGAGGSGGT